MNDARIEKRRYIRHPSDIPIEIGADNAGDLARWNLKNVSFGGICFHSAKAFENGKIVHLKIALVHPVFEADGRVVWCSGAGDGFDIGIEFVDTADAFRVRMVEQICHIEQYRKEVLEREGRSLNGKEAALEWIDKFAETF